MSSATPTSNIFRAATIFFAALVALAVALAVVSGDVDAAKKKTKKGSPPSITNVTPKDGVLIGDKLTLTGKNFVKGKKSMVVIFQREGSKRRFSTNATGLSTKKATVVVPNVSADLARAVTGSPPTLNMFRLRIVSKYGTSKALSSKSISPIIGSEPPPAGDPGAAGDCDSDGVLNGVDTDDDNDLLDDATELSIRTNVCDPDTDHDGPTDYYEYRVAYEYNGGPVLPYPGKAPYPNPLVQDSTYDFDNDRMTSGEEFKAWQYTKRMDRFYSDADQDSDGDGKLDGAEDEDHDLLANIAELRLFIAGTPPRPLNWLDPDTDGDGLCDGLDDQDHDGPPTPLATADCTTQVPNNGPGGTPATATGGGDPNGSMIDGDDNKYSNFYEWYIAGDPELSAGGAYNACDPDPYPISPYCIESPFNPFPVPDP